MNYCWHYTTGRCFRGIVETAAILTEDATTDIIIDGIPGAVWFSTRLDFEPTALKMDCTSIEEMVRRHEGLVRFGVPLNAAFLLTWEQFKQRCTCRKKILKSLERVAAKRGSNVKNFRASLEPVTWEQWAAVDVYDEGQWARVKITRKTE